MNRARLRAATFAAGVGLLLIPAIAAAATKFDPSTEFSLDRYVDLDFGPIDLSINKAVIYLLITTVILCVGCPLIVRAGLKSRPGRGQNISSSPTSSRRTRSDGCRCPPRRFRPGFPTSPRCFCSSESTT